MGGLWNWGMGCWTVKEEMSEMARKTSEEKRVESRRQVIGTGVRKRGEEKGDEEAGHEDR